MSTLPDTPMPFRFMLLVAALIAATLSSQSPTTTTATARVPAEVEMTCVLRKGA